MTFICTFTFTGPCSHPQPIIRTTKQTLCVLSKEAHAALYVISSFNLILSDILRYGVFLYPFQLGHLRLGGVS